jgi:hypothetical protein
VHLPAQFYRQMQQRIDSGKGMSDPPAGDFATVIGVIV